MLKACGYNDIKPSEYVDIKMRIEQSFILGSIQFAFTRLCNEIFATHRSRGEIIDEVVVELWHRTKELIFDSDAFCNFDVVGLAAVIVDIRMAPNTLQLVNACRKVVNILNLVTTHETVLYCFMIGLNYKKKLVLSTGGAESRGRLGILVDVDRFVGEFPDLCAPRDIMALLA
jgi:hypothetical protein